VGDPEAEGIKQRDLNHNYWVHKHHKKEVAKMARDPVCGMAVDEKSASAKSEHMGKTYYFCSPGCKKAFDENPAKYIGGGAHEMAGHSGH
jgi:YHS domain-containing protein